MTPGVCVGQPSALIAASASASASSVSPRHSACSASSPRAMKATKMSPQNGSSQVRRSSAAGLPRATSMNSAIADSTASGWLVTRTGKPSAISCA